MQTKIGIRLTDGAKRHLSAWQAEEPSTLFRIQASPACGGANWMLTPVENAWDSDTVVQIEGFSFVYSNFLEYLMEDVELDWLEDEDSAGPIFRVGDNRFGCA